MHGRQTKLRSAVIGGEIVNDKNLEQLMNQETEASELAHDVPVSDKAVRKSRTKSVIYSVRLTPEQINEIQHVADAADIPPSALVRDWVLQGLANEKHGSDVDTILDSLVKDVNQLQRHLSQGKVS